MRLKLPDLPRPDRKPCPCDPAIRARVEWERRASST